MWGAISEASSALVAMHVHLADKLADLTWNRVQVWNHQASVHSWKLGTGPTLAFDVVPQETEISITFIIRQAEWVTPVKIALSREGVRYTEHPTRPERLRLSNIVWTGESVADEQIEQIEAVIRSTRSAVERSVRLEQEWSDPATGITMRYSVKPERKACREIIFLFTSIRTKKHWLDFNGPYGPSLKTNRARIVFLFDEFADNFTYHLAVRGDTSVRSATAAFVRHYIESEGYEWEAVTLAGMSKGGTSAIVIGAHLPHCTVLALAPQLRLGDYLLSNRPAVLSAMTGGREESHASLVDDLMWSDPSIKQGISGIFRCYVLTSDGDPHCTEGIEQLRTSFNDPSRVSVSVDRSEHTSTHLQTVHYLSPLFISVLGLIAAGLRPDQLAPTAEPAIAPAKIHPRK